MWCIHLFSLYLWNQLISCMCMDRDHILPETDSQGLGSGSAMMVTRSVWPRSSIEGSLVVWKGIQSLKCRGEKSWSAVVYFMYVLVFRWASRGLTCRISHHLPTTSLIVTATLQPRAVALHSPALHLRSTIQQQPILQPLYRSTCVSWHL